MPEAFPAVAALFGSEFGAFGAGSAAAAAAGGIGTAAVGVGLNALLAKQGGISIPPPPGAAMIDPAGASATAQVRQRQAVAGGLGSTNTPGANNPAAFANATSGSKGLLGQ